jgi:hypothetical protein
MIRDSAMASLHWLEVYLQGVTSLRELILRGKYFAFHDGASFTPHANTLELLAIHHEWKGRELSAFPSAGSNIATVLSSLSVLRHLSVYVDGSVLVDACGQVISFVDHAQGALVS